MGQTPEYDPDQHRRRATTRRADDGGPLIPRRVILAVFLLVVGLLVTAVVIGLVRDQVNVDGLIIALMPVITGVLLGGAIRSKPRDGDQ